jgi:hypothetical protein
VVDSQCTLLQMYSSYVWVFLARGVVVGGGVVDSTAAIVRVVEVEIDSSVRYDVETEVGVHTGLSHWLPVE